MFDATFTNASLLKKIVTALTDVLKEVSFECTTESMTTMGMDASHVALVNLFIRADEDGPVFDSYRCDKPVTLSFKVESLAKVLKGVDNNATVQIILEQDSNECQFICTDKVLNVTKKFKINLLELESEHLGVPDAEYESEVQMPSAEFAKLMRDLTIHGESLQLNLDKNALSFSVKGDETSVAVEVRERRSKLERQRQDMIDQLEEGVKDESVTQAIEEVPDVEKEDDVDMEGEAPADEEEGVSLEKLKQEQKDAKKDKKSPKKPKTDIQKLEEKIAATESNEDENMSRVAFTVSQPIQTIYSLRYMNMFAKAAPLGNYVKLSVSEEQPIIVMFPLEDEKRGHLSFYLAPKIDE